MSVWQWLALWCGSSVPFALGLAAFARAGRGPRPATHGTTRPPR